MKFGKLSFFVDGKKHFCAVYFILAFYCNLVFYETAINMMYHHRTIWCLSTYRITSSKHDALFHLVFSQQNINFLQYETISALMRFALRKYIVKGSCFHMPIFLHKPKHKCDIDVLQSEIDFQYSCLLNLPNMA